MKQVTANVTVAVRMPPEMAAWLRRKAEEQDRSVNWIMNKMAQEAKQRDEEGRDGHPTP